MIVAVSGIMLAGGFAFMFLSYFLVEIQRLWSYSQGLTMSLLGGIMMLLGGMLIIIRGSSTGANKLIDLPKPKRHLILYVLKGGNTSLQWGYRQSEAHIGIKGKGNQWWLFQDLTETPLNMAGHSTRICHELIGATLDPPMILAINEFIRRYGVETYSEMRLLADIVAKNKSKPKNELKKIIEGYGFDPNPILQDIRYNKKLAVIVDAYFELREEWESEYDKTASNLLSQRVVE